jgi:hypothetical protein
MCACTVQQRYQYPERSHRDVVSDVEFECSGTDADQKDQQPNDNAPAGGGRCVDYRD